MNATLIAIIGLLLLFIGWMQYRHECWTAAVVERLTPLPEPARSVVQSYEAEPPALRYSDLFPEEPFELTQRINDEWGTFEELAPTRQLRPSIHPRFENYGTDISVSPTIGVT